MASSAAASAGVFQPAGGGGGSPIEAGFNAKPEKTETFEIGTKWDVLNERLSLTGAIFRITKTDARNLDPTTGFVVVNGKQRVDGFELGAAGDLTDKWKVFTNYTYLDSEILQSDIASMPEGGELDNTPRHTYNLWTSYRLPYAIEVGAGALYVDQRTNQPSGTQVAVTTDSYWRFDATASYPINKNITLRLNAINLADKEYIESLGGGQAIPGAGRTILLTTSFRY